MKKLDIKLLNDEKLVDVHTMSVHGEKVKIPLDYVTKLPTKSTVGSAGFDIYSPIDITLERGDTAKVPLRFSTAIPVGYCAFVLPRSGVGVKYKAKLCNTIGLIDSDYRGEWFISISIDSGWGGSNWKISKGDRIAQFVILESPQFELNVVDSLDDTIRGEGRFGHTGS